MAPITLNLLLVTLLFSLVIESTFVPLPSDHYSNQVLQKRSNLKIQKTTITKKGTTIDWILRSSQGKIASPPPIPQEFRDIAARKTSSNSTALISELKLPGTELGPPGTVPIPRVNVKSASLRAQTKAPPPTLATDKINKEARSKNTKRQFQNSRWYVFSGLQTRSLGCSSRFSMFRPFVEGPGDSSTLQNALEKPGQTIEAGWQYYPATGRDVSFFTYWSKDYYRQGGYNSDVSGWVQYDPSLYPGDTFEDLSYIDGAQYDLYLGWQLHNGAWWLFVQDSWIGYYPASLFRNASVPENATLATYADSVKFFGEVYQTGSQKTTTDMGSGHFAIKGAGKAGYIKSMRWMDMSSAWLKYNPASWVATDPSSYSFYSLGSSTFIGGPGAGGVVGG